MSQPLSLPARWALGTGTPTSLAAVAALSFQPQYALGQAVGWDSRVAWLLPVAVIVWEMVSTVVYFGSGQGHVRQAATASALTAVGASYGLSSTWHVLHPGTAPLFVTLVVSAVPNLVAASMLHLAMALASVPEAEPAAKPSEPVPEPEPEPEPVPELPEPPKALIAVPEPRKPARPRKASSAKEEARKFLAELPEGAETPSAAELAKRFDRTERWARTVLAEHRGQQTAA